MDRIHAHEERHVRCQLQNDLGCPAFLSIGLKILTTHARQKKIRGYSVCLGTVTVNYEKICGWRPTVCDGECQTLFSNKGKAEIIWCGSCHHDILCR